MDRGPDIGHTARKHSVHEPDAWAQSRRLPILDRVAATRRARTWSGSFRSRRGAPEEPPSADHSRISGQNPWAKVRGRSESYHTTIRRKELRTHDDPA
jgi:hypothetical protein